MLVAKSEEKILEYSIIQLAIWGQTLM